MTTRTMDDALGSMGVPVDRRRIFAHSHSGTGR